MPAESSRRPITVSSPCGGGQTHTVHAGVGLSANQLWYLRNCHRPGSGHRKHIAFNNHSSSGLRGADGARGGVENPTFGHFPSEAYGRFAEVDAEMAGFGFRVSDGARVASVDEFFVLDEVNVFFVETIRQGGCKRDRCKAKHELFVAGLVGGAPVCRVTRRFAHGIDDPPGCRPGAGLRFQLRTGRSGCTVGSGRALLPGWALYALRACIPGIAFWTRSARGAFRSGRALCTLRAFSARGAFRTRSARGAFRTHGALCTLRAFGTRVTLRSLCSRGPPIALWPLWAHVSLGSGGSLRSCGTLGSLSPSRALRSCGTLGSLRSCRALRPNRALSALRSSLSLKSLWTV